MTARTGVEMEALTAASVAALTLYDMAKALQRDIVIDGVRLLEKSGGRSGDYAADAGTVAGARATADHEAVIVTCSNRSAAGERDDASGPALVERLSGAGFDVAPEPRHRPRRRGGHRHAARGAGGRRPPTHRHHRRDRAVANGRDSGGDAAGDRPRGAGPGGAHALRRDRLDADGRAVARLSSDPAGSTLIVNVPGSPRGATESLDALIPVLRHALDQLGGGDH